MIPVPFAKGAMVFGPAIDPKQFGSSEAMRDALQAEMDKVYARAEHLVTSAK